MVDVSHTVKAGGSGQATLTVGEQGARQSVTLRATVSPGGPTVTLMPVTLSGPSTANLTVSTLRSTTPRTYTVTIAAVGASAGSAWTPAPPGSRAGRCP